MVRFVKVVVLIIIFSLLANILAFADNTTQPIVSSPLIVGTGEFGMGDGSAEEAVFGFPFGVAYSKKADALIIADTQNHRICSLNLKTLKISTIAGFSKGVDRFGFPGGGYVDGVVKKAMFNRPKGVAVAESGAIIVADTGNHAVRQIYNGKVTTIAGGKTAGCQDEKGIKAGFQGPSGITLNDNGIIYVSDTLNNVIRRIDTYGNVTTYAGKKDDNSILNEPVGIAIDKKGNLYVADSGNHQIKKITGKDKIEIVAGIHFSKDLESGYWSGGYIDGNAKASYFNFPKGISVKEDGTVYVTDTYNHVLREIKNDTVSTVVGGGVAGNKTDDKHITYFDGPAGVTYVKGTLFIADQWNNRIIIIPDKDKYLNPIKIGEDVETHAFIDNKKIEFLDVMPLYIAGELRIPIRAVGETWGAEVLWNQEEKSVTLLKGDKKVELFLDKGEFTIYKGRSMVSSEILENKLGLKVVQVEGQNIISIESN